MNASRLRACLVAVAALLAVAAPQAHAAGVTIAKVDARITGTQTVQWHDQSDGWPFEDRTWVLGRGTQTLKFATTAAVPMQLVVARIPGHRSVSLTSVARRQPKLGGALSRTSAWDHHAPRLCGGELGDCSTLQTPAEPTYDCGARQLPVHLTTLEGASQDGPGVRLVLTAQTSHPYALCPPDQPDGGAVADLQAASMGPIRLDHSLADVARLRRGKSITLTGSLLRGWTTSANFAKTCPKLDGPGYQQCLATKVEVELRRRG